MYRCEDVHSVLSIYYGRATQLYRTNHQFTAVNGQAFIYECDRQVTDTWETIKPGLWTGPWIGLVTTITY